MIGGTSDRFLVGFILAVVKIIFGKQTTGKPVRFFVNK